MSISRTHRGLIDYWVTGTKAFVDTDWTAAAGVTLGVDAFGLHATIVGSSTWRGIFLTAAPNLPGAYIYAVFSCSSTATSRVAVAPVIADLTVGSVDMAGAIFAVRGFASPSFAGPADVVAGTETDYGSGTSNLNNSSDHALFSWVDPLDATPNGMARANSTDYGPEGPTAQVTGKFGFFFWLGATSSAFRYLKIAYGLENRFVFVTGMAPGMIAKVRDSGGTVRTIAGSPIQATADGTGLATIDTFGDTTPLLSFDVGIYSSGGSFIEALAPLHLGNPDPVWGGDTYVRVAIQLSASVTSASSLGAALTTAIRLSVSVSSTSTLGAALSTATHFAATMAGAATLGAVLTDALTADTITAELIDDAHVLVTRTVPGDDGDTWTVEKSLSLGVWSEIAGPFDAATVLEYSDYTIDLAGPDPTYRTKLTNGAASAYSNEATVTMPGTATGPDAPTLTLILAGASGADWRSSSYVDARPAHSMDLIVETRAGVFVAGFSMPIDDAAHTSMAWREFTVSGIPTDEPLLRAKIRHNAVVDDVVYPGAYSATVDFELVVEEETLDPIDVPIVVTVNPVYNTDFPWPTTAITVHQSVDESDDVIAIGEPLFGYVTLGGVRKQVSPLNGWTAEFAYIPLNGTGGIVGLELYIRSFSSGFPVKRVEPSPGLWNVPQSFTPPYFVHISIPRRPIPAGGEAITGIYPLELAVHYPNTIETYTRFPNDAEDLVPDWILPYKLTFAWDPGYFYIPTWLRLESSQDEGATWQEVTDHLVGNVEEAFIIDHIEDIATNKWEYAWDTSGLESAGDTHKPTYLRAQTHKYEYEDVTAPASVEYASAWRQSAPFYIAHGVEGEEVFSRQRETLELSAFSVLGVDEEARWSEEGSGNARTFKRSAPGGAVHAGIAVLNEAKQPRSFEVIIEAKFKSGIYAALGTAGYVSESGGLFSAVLAHARGQFGAWNRDFGPVRAFTGTLFYWNAGIWYGKGDGGQYFADYGPHGPMTLPGFEKIADAGTGFTQWLGKPYIEPWYQMRSRYTKLEDSGDGTIRVKVERLLTGPDIGGFTFVAEKTYPAAFWPCGGVGFSSFTERGGSDEFRSIGVMVTDYGDCDPFMARAFGSPCDSLVAIHWTPFGTLPGDYGSS